MATKQSAAFGVFPQMQPRRSAQDREASKNVPVDLARGFVSGVAGAPGDIETIIRLLMNIQGPENFVMPKSRDEAMAMLGQVFGADRVSLDTALPTSEDVEKRLPFKSDAPVSQAFTGIGQLAGNFYTGPGAPIRLVAGIPKAVVRAGKDFVMAAPQGAPRMFVGPKAKTWDQAKADEAARMEKAGVDPVDIWRQTGTFRGADNIQRQEISDRGARFLSDDDRKERATVIGSGIDVFKEKIKPTKQKDLFPKNLTEAKKEIREFITRAKAEKERFEERPYRGVSADTILEHPELYKAYPELAGIKIATPGGRGNNLRGQLSVMPGNLEMDIFDSALRRDPTSTALHEMQHAIQAIEGMSPGGSSAMAFQDPRAFEILARLRKEASTPMSFDEYVKKGGYSQDDLIRAREEYDEYVADIPSTVKKYDTDYQRYAAEEYYKRLAGEAEARATQDRMFMTPDERTQAYPYSSYDVPQEDLLTKPPLKYAGGGALVKAVKAAQAVGRQAPSVVIPSAVSRVQEAVRQSKGDYGAKRVQRAADEIPNLERMYQEEALRSAFTGDNAKAMMTLNPADFENFAVPIGSTFTRANSVRRTSTGDKVTFPEYLEYLNSVGGFDSIPFLEINKQLQGTKATPYISGHEGRHRNRALTQAGEESGLVQLLPRSELREPFPRRSQEEYIEALKKELELTGDVVLPQLNINQPNVPQRPAIKLPDPYAKGGKVSNNLDTMRLELDERRMGAGGFLAKAVKGAQKNPPRTLSAGDIVNGMLVRKDIPNTSSIGASLTDYSTHGLQEVPMSAFETVGKPRYRNAQEEKRTKELARQIQENKELNPLIVVKDAEGYYILEGGHRFDALRELGIDSFPALMVHDLESLAVPAVTKAAGGAISADDLIIEERHL